jgi:hypothetical protein
MAAVDLSFSRSLLISLGPIVTLGRILTTLVSAVFMRPEVAGISSPEAVPDAVERPGQLCLGPLRRDW